jgi:DNA-binding transcriptional MerR regulator
LGTTVDTLRNWDRNSLIDVPRDPNNQYRQYSQTEISRLRVIRMLRAAGYSMMAIYRMMKHLDAGKTENLGQVLDTPQPDEDVFAASDRWLSALQEQEQRGLLMIAQLEEMIKKAQVVKINL